MHVKNNSFVIKILFKGKDRKCETKHVFVCGYHSKERINQEILEKYKRNVIEAHQKFFEFTNGISMLCF